MFSQVGVVHEAGGGGQAATAAAADAPDVSELRARRPVAPQNADANERVVLQELSCGRVVGAAHGTYGAKLLVLAQGLEEAVGADTLPIQNRQVDVDGLKRLQRARHQVRVLELRANV